MTKDPVEQVLRRISEPMSLRRRVRYLLLLFAAATMTTLVAVLWSTERDLPPKTQLTFGLMVALGIGWAAYALLALRQRGRLFALDRVIAGRLAVGFAIVGAVGIALILDGPAQWAGAVPIAAAAVALTLAHAERSRLRRLERRLINHRGDRS